jgi:hypothetical protein
MASSVDLVKEVGLLDLSDGTPFPQWEIPTLSDPSRLGENMGFDTPCPAPSVSLQLLSPPSCTAADTLPSEILLEIFSILTYDITDSGSKWYYSPHLVAMTHVCMRWRTLALSTPSLWTRISFAYESEALACTMLMRSGDRPVDLAFGSRFGGIDALPGALGIGLAVGLKRVRALNLHVPSEQLARCAGLMSARFQGPTLERLQLCAYGRAFQGNMFAELHTPRIRSIVLDGVPVDARAIESAAELRELVLTGFPNSWRWSVREVLSLIQRVPALRKLALTEAVRVLDEDEDGDSAALPDVGLVELTQLTQLTLHAPTRAVATLLAHLTIESTTTCIINCVARAPEDCMLADCIPRGMRFARLSVRMSITESSMVFHSTINPPKSHTDREYKPALELTLQPERVLAPMHSSGLSALLDVCTRAGLSKIRSLSLTFDDVIRDDDVPVLLHGLGEAMSGAVALEIPNAVLERVHNWGKLGKARKIVVRNSVDSDKTMRIVREKFQCVEEAVIGGKTTLCFDGKP